MNIYIIAQYEEKWDRAELPFLNSGWCVPTNATPKRMMASVKRAKEKYFDKKEVKKSDGKPFTRTLKRIFIDNGFEKRVVWEREKGMLAPSEMWELNRKEMQS